MRALLKLCEDQFSELEVLDDGDNTCVRQDRRVNHSDPAFHCSGTSSSNVATSLGRQHSSKGAEAGISFVLSSLLLLRLKVLLIATVFSTSWIMSQNSTTAGQDFHLSSRTPSSLNLGWQIS